MRTCDGVCRRWRNVTPKAYWASVGIALGVLTACSGTHQLTANEVLTRFGHDDICGLPAVTTTSNFLLLLAAGLLAGFSHCAGMCGPLVTMFVVRRQTNNHNAPASRDTLTPLVLYQVGRVATYVGLGVAMGMVGALMRVHVIESGWQGRLSILIGGLMVLTGLSLWGILPWLRWLESAKYARHISLWMRRSLQSNYPAAPFVLGVANGLLPCGAVYAMALVAATSGNPIQGAMIMFTFGLGTLPAMLGVSFLAMRLSFGLRSQLYRFAALLVMVVGLQLTLRGLAVTGVVPHASISGMALW